MEVFWTALIEPLLQARKAQRIVEVGCDHGATTAHLVEFCGQFGGELHVIDPAPKINPARWQRWQQEAPGKFTLHRKRSLEVLDDLPCAAILIDGDHNWYTVFHELKAIELCASRHGTLPLILLHDVAWPYGRRDMYYDPESIPAEYRQPYRQEALAPGNAGFADSGWNAHLHNALHEGGERNGVLTAVEDFLAAAPGTYFLRCVPLFHGLGILCPVALLEKNSELADLLNNLDQRIVRGGLLERVEAERLAKRARAPAAGDLEALEWTLGALSKSARWRIGNAIVNAGRRLLGLPRAAQVTDTLRDLISSRQRHRATLTAQAALLERAPPTATTDEVISSAFHQLYYNEADRTWRQTRWLGVTVWKCPLDLWIYQEIIHETQPDLIIETGTAFGGSALYLASLCDQMRRGQIITIDIQARADRPVHPRIQYVTGDSADSKIVDQIAAAARNAGRVMVILDSDHRCAHVLAELHAYATLVTDGCYLIVEDTNINGHPVYTEYGPGPKEAVELFLAETPSFEIDRSREKFYLTFNPAGYLRRHATGTATE